MPLVKIKMTLTSSHETCSVSEELYLPMHICALSFSEKNVNSVA